MGKKIHICAIPSTFQQDEAHLSKAAFFNELAEDGESLLTTSGYSSTDMGRP